MQQTWVKDKPLSPKPVQVMEWWDIILSIATVGIWYFILVSKWKIERMRWNAERIGHVIFDSIESFKENTVEAIDKKGWALNALSKSEILYYQTTGLIFSERFLKNGTKRTKIHGKGQILVTNKAITIYANDVKSGKRRFLFKNISKDITIPFIDGGDQVLFSHKDKWVYLDGTENTLKALSMALFLKENDMKADDSISF